MSPRAGEEPLISVIIPTLNEADELPGTLDSVHAALHRAEIIVVDGGSRDATRQRAAGRARVLETTPGRGQQLNAGIQAARGELLLFLHADTRLSPGAERALRASRMRPEVVGGCFELGLRGPTADRFPARVLARAINLRSRWLKTATGDQAIFARAETCRQVGGFPDLPLFEDVLFFRRLRKAGQVVVLRPPVQTSDRRWRRDGYLRTIATHLRLRLLFFLGIPPTRLIGDYHRSR